MSNTWVTCPSLWDNPRKRELIPDTPIGSHGLIGKVPAAEDGPAAHFCLIPEVPFKLENFLAALKQRIVKRAHALIMVAEGVGQDWLGNTGAERDASGNVKLGDIGTFLRAQIEAYFKTEQIPIVMRYFDPSYHVRSGPANSEDSILCDLFARNAVHAAMAGKTDMLIGHVCGNYVHVPLEMAVEARKRMNVEGELWSAVLSATGQPRRFE